MMRRWRITWTTPSGQRAPLGVVVGLTMGGAVQRARRLYPWLPRHTTLVAVLADPPSNIGLPNPSLRAAASKRAQGFAVPAVQARAHSPEAEAKRRAARAALTEGQRRWRDLRRRRRRGHRQQRPPE